MQSSAQYLAAMLVKALPARSPLPLLFGITEVKELNTNSREARVTDDKPPLLCAQQHHHHPNFVTEFWSCMIWSASPQREEHQEKEEEIDSRSHRRKENSSPDEWNNQIKERKKSTPVPSASPLWSSHRTVGRKTREI